MTYDEKCFDLAQHFLADEIDFDGTDAAALAQAIQTTIEDWLVYMLPDRLRKRRNPV